MGQEKGTGVGSSRKGHMSQAGGHTGKDCKLRFLNIVQVDLSVAGQDMQGAGEAEGGYCW